MQTGLRVAGRVEGALADQGVLLRCLPILIPALGYLFLWVKINNWRLINLNCKGEETIGSSCTLWLFKLGIFSTPFWFLLGFFPVCSKNWFSYSLAGSKNKLSLWPYPQNGSAASTEISRSSSPTKRSHERPTASHETTSTFWYDARSSSTTSPPFWTSSIWSKHASDATSGRDSSTNGTSTFTGKERAILLVCWVGIYGFFLFVFTCGNNKRRDIKMNEKTSRLVHGVIKPNAYLWYVNATSV